MSTTHAKAAKAFLSDKVNAEWHDKTLYMVRTKRDRLSHAIPEWEDLRHAVRDLKLYSNSHLPELIEEFEKKATANGCHVHYAKDAEEYRSIIEGILRDHGARKLVKSKSMLSEECHLNPYLIEKGYEVIESDLGERILQLLNAHPSHIVMPAIHLKREIVGKLFEEKLGSEKDNFDPTYLTRQARRALRQDFLNADAGMTGGNFAVASTGEVVVCTNEGNADMGMSCQKLNICAFGIDKIIPDLESLGIFTRLLQVIAASDKYMSVPVHASITGKVAQIAPHAVAGGAQVPCVTIESDGSDETAYMSPLDPFSCDAKDVLERIRLAGIVGMGGASFPTYVKLSPPDSTR